MIVGDTRLDVDHYKRRLYFKSAARWDVGCGGTFPPNETFVAMYPPLNVLAVFQDTPTSASYVTFEQLINLDRATLTNSMRG